uniref:Uncharacterized protein n=1 Tax=Candidatus Kentrum sp. FM TaxID=2126340 RepID=A0A450VLZ5_9GAMM|nr:MAG: hypothetical protein BECKFM1743A_GA0114220_100224 [Candidatus Kentron sp. FM]VFJ63058.1 MAG: hypothetical protein BECKFM1743C_GA0114222_103334 [Candidatus Kentron sp. FM]VFK05823.1 MAG: hypothetical protein BECKFM1743B_GA0114221_100058 [Candidatus Kentron sp. FM]
MLDRITNHPELFGLLRQSCEENGIGVRICDEFMDNGQLREDTVRILKVDAYYSSRNMHSPPPAIDCLIIIETGEGAFGLTLVELKNISSTRKADLKPRAIRPKFDTVIEDFLSKEFADIFLDNHIRISHFRLWLVTNPYRWPPMSEEAYRKKLKNIALKMFLSDKPYRFRGNVARIEPKQPGSEVCA